MSTYFDPVKSKAFKTANLPVPVYLKEFLDHEAITRNLSPRTVQNYYISLQTFLRWLVCRDMPEHDFSSVDVINVPFEEIEKITASDISEFMVYCGAERNNGSRSRASKLSAVKAFFRYLSEETNRIPSNPLSSVHGPKLERPQPKYLSEDEAVRLISACNTGETPERDTCIATLFLNCGMRLTELVALNIGDIKDDKISVKGKGRKGRTLYLNNACRESLESWLDTRRLYDLVDKKALFVSRRFGKRLTGRAVETMIKKALLRAGLEAEGYSPHKLRHTAATLMYKSGAAGVLELQAILGHESIGMVERYTHLDDNQIRAAMNNFEVKKQEIGE